MDTACKRALVDLRVQLLSGLRCDKRLMDHLASTKVVDVEQSNWILQPQSDEEQARRLLDLLPKLGEHAWTELLKGLRKSGPGTNSELCEKLERQVQLPATVRTVSSEAETGAELDNSDEQESTLSQPSPTASPTPSRVFVERNEPAAPVFPLATRQQTHGQPAMLDRMTTSAYLPRGQDVFQPSMSASTGFWGTGPTSLPQPQRYQAPSPRGQWPAQPRSSFQLLYESGVKFRELSDRELEEIADQLYARIVDEFPRLVNALLCSIPQYRVGAAQALRKFQRENEFHGELFALLKLWLMESIQPCTGLDFYRALEEVSGEGLAAQCSDILQLPPR